MCQAPRGGSYRRRSASPTIFASLLQLEYSQHKVSQIGMLVSHPHLLAVPICLEEVHTVVPVIVVAVHAAQGCLCCVFAWTEHQYDKVIEEGRGCARRKRTLYVGCMIVGPVNVTVNADD